MTLVNVYDSPTNSSYKINQKRMGNNTVILEEVENLILQNSDTDIFLAGDFNARTGTSNSTANSNGDTADQ